MDNETHLKGIVLAGGSGTRLYPITEGVSKQLLPIYDKPMIYYPISVLMLAGIRDILIITTKEDQSSFQRLLKDGSQFGIHFEYVVQPSPNGIAEAFILGEQFIQNEPVALILGDNLFYGNGFVKMLKDAAFNAEKGKATNFGIEVPDPERFGIMEVKKEGSQFKILSVEEKPQNPKSNYAITGLYFYPSGVVEKAKTIKPSARGELEITTLNDMYLNEGNLLGELLGGGFNWFDTGTFDSYFDAISSVKSIEQNRGRIVACLEQIAYDQGWIGEQELEQRSKVLSKNRYGKYLQEIRKERGMK
ncbi:MAG: glucose-1-phosphate thymidylyltransferase RfbA [Tenericutes bacterium]|nr:glucose-1-phosphate thymidylyltransferase RfbA [Mycoplasmatota bacterium]